MFTKRSNQMSVPLISSFPIPSKMFFEIGLSPNIKRKLLLSVSFLLHPLIYLSIFSEFDKILQMLPSEREPEIVRYYANLCGEWYQILTSYLKHNPHETRKKLPFSERLFWNRIESRYISEIEWYAECFADILNPDEQVRQKTAIILDMMKENDNLKCNP